MGGLIFQSGQVMRGKRTDASGRPSSALPNADKLLKYLPSEPEEVMLALAELQVLPKELHSIPVLKPFWEQYRFCVQNFALEVHKIEPWNLKSKF